MTKKAYFGNPELEIIRTGTPREVAGLLEEMIEEGEIASEERLDHPEVLEKYRCGVCGRNYLSEMELLMCPECGDNPPISGDYDWNADEDDSPVDFWGEPEEFLED